MIKKIVAVVIKAFSYNHDVNFKFFFCLFVPILVTIYSIYPYYFDTETEETSNCILNFLTLK